MPKRSQSADQKTGNTAIPDSNRPEINQEYASFRLEVRPSAIHRWGIYAGEDIRRRRKVIEYTGERISRRETKRRAEANPGLIYLFTLDNYWTLDGSAGGSGAEFINHCCDPSLVTEIRSGHILYIARRDIRYGEELTVDYHFAKDVERIPCSCGAKACRGTINLLK